MTDQELVRVSKFLSLVLRHQPQKIGLTLDENGWTDVANLLRQINKHGLKLTSEELQYVVATNNKKRFAFSQDQTQIRASQGHSIAINLDYQPVAPPDTLYHGTSDKSVPAILSTGLEKRNRHHVHLSRDIATALNVGSRHGKPAVLRVAALNMHHDGFVFYLSENQVWLTDYVPSKYLTLLSKT